MQTLIPTPVTASAYPNGKRLGRALAFGLTPRTLLLLFASTFLSIPAFLHGRTPWLMFAVDGLLLLAAGLDAATLPAPESFSVTRRFLHAPELGRAVEVELTVVKTAFGVHDVRFTDDLKSCFQVVQTKTVTVSYPNEPSSSAYSTMPVRRGDAKIGKLYLRYRSVLRLAERWAVADLDQTVRVYAAGEAAGDSSALYLLRARQIELEKRRLRVLGLGREFESMRDYQTGDEVRNISWSATARHNRLITRQYTTERSQQVWIVLDAGRLSNTALELDVRDVSGSDHAARVVTQLDQAASAAGLLARVVDQSGDKCALLTYGRVIQQQLLPASGALHIRRLVDALSQVHSEAAEGDHRLASIRLRQLQRKRGLILWITEMTEAAGQPEIVSAVTELVHRHVVVLVLLRHPELNQLAQLPPSNTREMYAAAAAQEMLERRRGVLAKLRAQGVLLVETSASSVAADTISRYLEVKAQGQI